VIIIIMGVSGSGKTAIGRALASRLGCPFYDADDYHPPENIAKMSRGIPLNDDDRLPWLRRLNEVLAGHSRGRESAVLACSALKRRYRDILRSGIDQLQFVYLQGSFELIWDRMQRRSKHYMKADMLQSQFEDLEAPGEDEALTVDVSQSLNAAVRTILDFVQHRGNSADPSSTSGSKGET
jgi:gluconokinase